MNKPPDLPIVHLKQGECIVSGERILVATVLGSCVGATFFLPRRQVGGMFHALLPCREEASRASDDQPECRFVDGAIEHMLTVFLGCGAMPGELEAKLFGGSDMFAEGQGGGAQMGRRNIEKAEDVLRAAGVRVLSSDVGGVRGRKILFSPTTGEVWVRLVGRKKPALCTCTSKPRRDTI